MKVRVTLFFFYCFFIISCDSWDSVRRRLGLAPEGRLVPVAEPRSGRFALLHTTTRSPSGENVAVMFRIDTATGETWRLNTKLNRWDGVQDDLNLALTFNPKTKKIERGFALPDGRDLNELTNDELIRYLQRYLTANDPLGIRPKQTDAKSDSKDSSNRQ